MERGKGESEKGKAIKLSGNQVSYDQADSILVEPWGGTGGSKWDYKLKSPIKEILVAHGDIIDSIIFITVTEQGTTIDSPKFGGGGGRKDKVVIEATPLEYLTGIKGTFGHCGSHLVIKSLCFITNAKNYGPFGPEAGGTPFSLVMKEGVAIVGFHGRYGAYLDAIGVYLQKLAPPNSAKEPMVEDIEIRDVSFSTLRKDSLNVLDFIESLKNEEIQEAVDMDLTNKLILELDFLILNLHHLSKYCVEELSPFMTEYEILHNVCGNIRDFHELIVNGCVGHEIVEYVLPQFQLMAERVGRFLWHNQICGHSRLFKLAHLFVEVIPTQLEVMHICLTNLKDSTSAEVGRFIKQLLETSPDILREYLIHLQEHMINVITASTQGARNIHIMIEFLLIILTDVPKDFIHNDKLFEFLARVGALTRDVSAIARDLEEKSKNAESTNETNSATLGLLENIELLKRELKDVYLKAPDSSQLCFPMSDRPLFMHLLLRHLNDLLNSDAYLVALIKEEIRLVKEDLEFIRSFFGNVEQELYKDLWARVLDVAYETKDVINSIIVRENGLLHLIFSLPFAIEKINLIKEGVSNIFEKIPKNMGVIVVNSPNKPVERKSSIAGKIIVGFKEETHLIIRKLTSGPKTLDVISITGMPGAGKTTLAYEVYNNKSVFGHFDIRAWCTVDQKYDEMELLKKLFNQVVGSSSKFGKNVDVFNQLRKNLFGKRYLIVLDDLWDTAAWEELTRPFPEVENGSRIILTTREKKVAMHAQRHSDPLDLRWLRPEESWELLEKKVFGKESCPSELLDVGKEIVRNCKRLPLVVDLIAGVIVGKEKKRSVWLEVRNNLNSFIFQKEENVMNVIALSYDHLPDPLKLCLLYFASFEKDRAIPVEVLKRLWRAEGFAEHTEMNSVEEVMDVYLDNLISSSLVISFKEIGKDRTCQIHDLVHDFCLIKAREEKLFDSTSSSAPSSSSSDPMPRQMAIRCSKGHKNFILFDSKNKRHFGYKHLYSLRITDYIYHDKSLHDICHLRHLRLLRVLQLDDSFILVNDSLLNEICTLVHLRYLEIRTEVKSLPSSFSNLLNLETLWVNKYGPPMVILPTIWNLVKLRVLGIDDCSFFDLVHLDKNEPILIAEDSKSENLRLIQGLKLSYSKDTEDIFKRFPNLQELRFNLKESWDCSTGRYWLPKLDFVNELQSLKVTFERGRFAPSVAANRPLWDFNFPSSLKDLWLRQFPLTSGLLSTIAKLPKLEDLYLEDAIIEGEGWNMGEEDTFQNLKCLTLQRVTLATWEVREESFPALEKLRLRHCRKLEEIPPIFGDICSLKSIELRWSPQLEESALKIKQDVEDMMGEDRIQVLIYKY
ncbi:PREDICTED: putative late blight resistance protein homolog R1B-23 [Nicotiana attenuata]|uniref:Late blight resistance protein -like r1b-16 n=1 Tax=Nicotiana attenuata TaxID=49451 RepID=A0A1J6IQY4_NICAT|nr:PREDICTED: putative late blight resistance protein homolog R1B-23 [Nicotiana attenuata]XP_019259040.1 PREDICTED: putative late blight resistance protein homolog R1B-23 [Nicotiana attenuata]OIT07262.1 putative late blight resistance protein -like r1b-16 [Nicotiana attenuata]